VFAGGTMTWRKMPEKHGVPAGAGWITAPGLR
jgi:hypothetical protein